MFAHFPIKNQSQPDTPADLHYPADMPGTKSIQNRLKNGCFSWMTSNHYMKCVGIAAKISN